MTPATPSDRPTGVTVTCPIRWGDMDALGHVNNIIFFQYCESARIAYFDALEIGRFKRQPTDGPGMVAANLNFRRQLKYPGTVDVTAHTTQVGERSFTLAYTIVDRADGAVVADGTSVCLWVDYAAGKALRLPDDLVSQIARLEEKPELAQRTPPTAG
ncbi:MAG: acyl-CoA thioesterase [Planctomycetaceae bacterium]|nr:acyl-CoA thioesterase [Planctomycetaceae bacterium]